MLPIGGQGATQTKRETDIIPAWIHYSTDMLWVKRPWQRHADLHHETNSHFCKHLFTANVDIQLSGTCKWYVPAPTPTQNHLTGALSAETSLVGWLAGLRWGTPISVCVCSVPDTDFQHTSSLIHNNIVLCQKLTCYQETSSTELKSIKRLGKLDRSLWETGIDKFTTLKMKQRIGKTYNNRLNEQK